MHDDGALELYQTEGSTERHLRFSCTCDDRELSENISPDHPTAARQHLHLPIVSRGIHQATGYLACRHANQMLESKGLGI